MLPARWFVVSRQKKSTARSGQILVGVRLGGPFHETLREYAPVAFRQGMDAVYEFIHEPDLQELLAFVNHGNVLDEHPACLHVLRHPTAGDQPQIPPWWLNYTRDDVT